MTITREQLAEVARALLVDESPQLSTATITVPARPRHTYEVHGRGESLRIVLGVVPFTPRWDDIFPRLVQAALDVRRSSLVADGVRGEGMEV